MMDTTFLPRADLQRLLDALHLRFSRVIGPRVHDGAITYEPIERATDLPVGWYDEQSPGRYRLHRAEGDGADRCFDWANGPQAIKPLTYVPRETLWRVTRDPQGHLAFTAPEERAEPTAVIGVRACDLAALHLQDQHFAYGTFADPSYNRRRRALFLVAVDCARPAATCFCASTGDGPQATSGFDVALTELDDGFVVRAKSDAGRALVASLGLQPAGDARVAAVCDQADRAGAQARSLPGRDLKQALFERLTHPRWDEVGARCLSCGNCTAVCPTCFCHSEVESPSLDGRTSEHVRQWDSCFNTGHSYLHGWVVRGTTPFRYRQWLTHKLGSWHDQYGRSGCTGCGRCITWCPVGIDITEEAGALLAGKPDARS